MSNAFLPKTLIFALMCSAAGLSAAAESGSTAKPAPIVTRTKAPTLPVLSVAQIVDKNVEARGGLAAWRKVQSMSWKGMMGAGGTTYATVTPKGQLRQGEREEMQLPFRLEFKRPLKSRLELDFNGETAVQVFDGASGWKLRPYLNRKDWVAYTPDELKQATSAFGIDGWLIDYAAKGARVELAGTDTVEGNAAYKLKVTRKDGQVRHLWVDGKGFLDIKMDGEPRKLDGKMHAVAVYLRNFKAEQGLMIPRLQETVVEGVKKTEKIALDGVTVNPNLDDSRFVASK